MEDVLTLFYHDTNSMRLLFLSNQGFDDFLLIIPRPPPLEHYGVAHAGVGLLTAGVVGHVTSALSPHNGPGR